MKKVIFLALLLVGCTTTKPPAPTPLTTAPPLPPGAPSMPVATPKAQPSLRVIRPKVALAAASAPAAPVVPAWNFPNLNGTYTIDASTNLVDWQTVAVVYDAKSLNLSSDTTQKRTVIFYRITPSF